MTTPVHPDALRTYRARKHWTQGKLAEATKGMNKVSLPTIKRIESTKGDTYPANDRVAEGLAKALGVSPDDLSKPPTDEAKREASLRQFGYRPLRTMLDAETAMAFNMVQHIYGIPIHSQIVMAPLFAALLAEGSLTWRRERVAKIEDAAKRLMDLGGGHFSFANAANRSLEGAAEERDSIGKRDLFGEHVGDDTFHLGYNPSQNNPFADFLDHFAKQVEAKTVSFERGTGWKTSEGMPEYRIGADLFDQLTGDDLYAEYALLRGHVRLRDIPADLLSDENEADRIAWIIAQIPEDERAKRTAELEELGALVLDLDTLGLTETSDEAKGSDNA